MGKWRKRVLFVGLIAMVLLTVGFVGIAVAQDAAAPAADAVTGPMPEIDPGASAGKLIEGIGARNWTLILAAGGLVLMYLVRLIILPRLKGKGLSITSTVIIGLAAMCTSLVAGADLMSSIGIGLTAALAAGKAWDLIPDKITDAAEKSIKKKQV